LADTQGPAPTFRNAIVRGCPPPRVLFGMTDLEPPAFQPQTGHQGDAEQGFPRHRSHRGRPQQAGVLQYVVIPDLEGENFQIPRLQRRRKNENDAQNLLGCNAGQLGPRVLVIPLTKSSGLRVPLPSTPRCRI